jgi:predicted GIY-YIG superfamily endonuclease
LKKRILQHNSKNTISTRYRIPWRLVYYEAFVSKIDALARERRLKRGTSAIGFLKRRIKNSLDSNRKEWGVANG